mmetsp:Transcript_32182/g.31503  ORF Transcript_32182/g.31503 Transcript_32182/m.31503 type:complete len:264 (-) Transcript_32182:43-834(-)
MGGSVRLVIAEDSLQEPHDITLLQISDGSVIRGKHVGEQLHYRVEKRVVGLGHTLLAELEEARDDLELLMLWVLVEPYQKVITFFTVSIADVSEEEDSVFNEFGVLVVEEELDHLSDQVALVQCVEVLFGEVLAGVGQEPHYHIHRRVCLREQRRLQEVVRHDQHIKFHHFFPGGEGRLTGDVAQDHVALVQQVGVLQHRLVHRLVHLHHPLCDQQLSLSHLLIYLFDEAGHSADDVVVEEGLHFGGGSSRKVFQQPQKFLQE